MDEDLEARVHLLAKNYLAEFDLTNLEARKRAIRRWRVTRLLRLGLTIDDLHRDILRLIGTFETLDRRRKALCLELDSLLPRPSLIRSLFRKSARPRRGIPFGIAWDFKYLSLVDEARWLNEEMDSTLLEMKENMRKANEMQQAHQSLSRKLGISMFW